MKISKLLNRKYLSIITIFLALNLHSLAEEKPVDIWKIDKENKDKDINSNVSISENEQDSSNPTDIYNMQSKNKNISVKIEQSLDSQEVKIIGLYDPEDYGLEMSMWLNSNGDQLKNIFSNLIKLNLSKDAAELMNILLLTNAYYPSNNISEKEFLKIKSDWLIRNNDLELIEKYLVKNQILNLHPELTRFLVDEYLSRYDIAVSVEDFCSESNMLRIIDYLQSLIFKYKDMDGFFWKRSSDQDPFVKTDTYSKEWTTDRHIHTRNGIEILHKSFKKIMKMVKANAAIDRIKHMSRVRLFENPSDKLANDVLSVLNSIKM